MYCGVCGVQNITEVQFNIWLSGMLADGAIGKRGGVTSSISMGGRDLIWKSPLLVMEIKGLHER